MIISSTMYKRNVKTRAWRKLSNNDTLESVTVLLWILSARAREAQICNTQVGEKHTVWTRMLDYTLLTTPSPQPCFLGNEYKLYSNKSYFINVTIPCLYSNTYKHKGQFSERELTFQQRVFWYLLPQRFHSPFCLHCRSFLMLWMNNFPHSEGIIQSESESVWQPNYEENIWLQTETITKYWIKLPTFGL